MRILITGITGFVGGYLATHLMQEGATELYGVDRHAKRLLPELKDVTTCFVGDLQSEVFVKDVLQHVKPDAIYHLAGQPFVPTAWSNPWETIQLNVLPQLNLLKGLVELELETRFLSVTSGKVYGQAFAERIPFTEEMHLRPDNPYDLSKVTEDLMALQYYLSHKLHIIRARPFNHIGPRQTPRFVAASFAQQIAQAEAGARPPVINVGNLTAARDFTDVRDVVRAYSLLIKDGRPGEAYNIGSGKAVTIQHILDILLSMSKVDIQVEQDPARLRPVDQPVSYGSIKKITQHVGWRPTIPLKQTLRDILGYWREQVSR